MEEELIETPAGKVGNEDVLINHFSKFEDIFFQLKVLSCLVESIALSNKEDNVLDPGLYRGISIILNGVMDEFERLILVSKCPEI